MKINDKSRQGLMSESANKIASNTTMHPSNSNLPQTALSFNAEKCKNKYLTNDRSSGKVQMNDFLKGVGH